MRAPLQRRDLSVRKSDRRDSGTIGTASKNSALNRYGRLSILVVATVALAMAPSAAAAGQVDGTPTQIVMQDPETQAAVTITLNLIEDQYPRDFAYARAGAAPLIAFRGSAPAGARSLLARVPQQVEIVEGVGFAQEELVAAENELNNALIAKFGRDGIGLSIDETGTVNITMHLVAPEPGDGPRARTSANVEAVLATTSARTRAVPVRLVDDPSRSGSDSQWVPTGGTGVSVDKGGPATYCTEGFVAKYASAADLGPLTAGHCANHATLWHNGGTPKLSRRVAVDDSRGDAAFYRSAQMMAGIIRVDWGQYVGIHGNYNPVIGNDACRFGVTSGATCQTVIDLNRCAGGVCGLVWTDQSVTMPGDSGGPWYYGTYALGIHKGWLDEKEHWYSIGTHRGEIFTPIRTVLSLTSTVLCYDEAPDPKCVAR